MVQIYYGSGQPWDAHGISWTIADAGKSDQLIAALIQDLKQRGLLDDTLIIWGGILDAHRPLRENRTESSQYWVYYLAVWWRCERWVYPRSNR